MATEKWLIDAKAVIKGLQKEISECECAISTDNPFVKFQKRTIPKLLQNVIDYIALFPTVDAVEVVRCKDCKHCSQNTPDGLHWCDEHEVGSLMDDDFCSYGERRTDG